MNLHETLDHSKSIVYIKIHSWVVPSMGLDKCIMIHGASPVAQMVKNLPAIQEIQFNSWVRKIPWRREWLPTPVCLPGEFNGQRSLANYSPWGHKELDTTEQLTDTHTYTHPYNDISFIILPCKVFSSP